MVEPIIPERGLRQGNPLSQYLFILCSESLSAIIDRATATGSIHGSKICQGVPNISHLLFTDDNFLFLRGTLNES